MSTFILELFSEEIPSKMQAAACAHLKSYFSKKLEDAGLVYSALEGYITPRRMSLKIEGLPLKQEDRREERKGPRVDAPEQAIQGFLSSTGLTLEQCTQKDLGKKGTFLFADIEIPGRATGVLLAEVVESFLRDMSWPKSMRWASKEFSWVRPLHHILALFEGFPLHLTLPVSTMTQGAYTYGHRFLAPEQIEVSEWQGYVKSLEEHFVILDQDKRRALILQSYQEIAEKHQARLPEDVQTQIAEVAGLVEYPVVCVGSFSKDFLQVPEEVLITSMWTHQFFTPLLDKTTGRLLPLFLFTSNVQAPEGMNQIIRGNEAVLEARLRDAQFFWQSDLKQNFDAWTERLKNQIFHEDLGSVYDRVQRLEALGKAARFNNQELHAACRYAKADLSSSMVGEFPELQGIMGGFYLHHKGFSEAVSQAVRTQYAEEGFFDETGALLAVIEKLDVLTAFFAMGIKPTSSKDPYSLRRAALGIIKIIQGSHLSLDLLVLIRLNYDLIQSPKKIALADYEASLKSFFEDRFRYLLRQTHRPDVIEAAFKKPGNFYEFGATAHLCAAFESFLDQQEGKPFLNAYRRVHNILQHWEKETGAEAQSLVFDAELLSEKAEKTLAEKVEDVSERMAGMPALSSEDFKNLFTTLAEIQPVLDSFFDHVMVNHEDQRIKTNRIALLARVRVLFEGLGDFSQIQEC